MAAAALHLELDLVLGLCLLPGLGLGLSFQPDPRSVVAAGLPFGSLCRDTLRGLIHSGQQLVEPRRPVVLPGFILHLPYPAAPIGPALAQMPPGDRAEVVAILSRLADPWEDASGDEDM
jgi:hypothetical protein